MIVLTQLPLLASLSRSDYTRRVVKWVTMLGAFDIKYLPRMAMKSQILVDLVAVFTKELGDSKGVGKLEEAVRMSSVVA